MRSTGDIQFFVCRSRIIPEPPFPSQGIAGSGNEIVVKLCCNLCHRRHLCLLSSLHPLSNRYHRLPSFPSRPSERHTILLTTHSGGFRATYAIPLFSTRLVLLVRTLCRLQYHPWAPLSFPTSSRSSTADFASFRLAQSRNA